MSHTPTTPSAPGTPLADQTVGEIVAANPNLSRVFQTHGIGFCCQGKLTLRRACERNQVDLDTMLADLEEAAAGTPAPDGNPSDLPLADLADYIVEHHHGFLRTELPRIHAMAERVAQVHGGHTPSLIEVYEVFTEMGQKMAAHARQQESTLFPALTSLEGGDDLFQHIDAMVEAHESIVGAISRLRELTNGYAPPADACNTYRALFAGLADLEADTGQHFHLENNVLFPGALKRAS